MDEHTELVLHNYGATITNTPCPRGCLRRTGCNCILRQSQAIILRNDGCNCVARHAKHWAHGKLCNVTPIYVSVILDLQVIP